MLCGFKKPISFITMRPGVLMYGSGPPQFCRQSPLISVPLSRRSRASGGVESIVTSFAPAIGSAVAASISTSGVKYVSGALVLKPAV